MVATTNLYGYPDMGRTGLGHSLLAWGRCAVWCRDSGATMLAPRWLRPRIGPYLRQERDKRNYFLMFHKAGYVWEPRRSWLLLTANRLHAELDLPEPGYSPRRPTVVVFRNALANNERKMFHLVANEGAFLREQFLAMTKAQYVPKGPEYQFIAVHVRMGDFNVATREHLKLGANNVRIPIEWYAAMVCKLRSQLGVELPAVVFSDGPDDALAPLLELSSITRAPRRPAVTDMLSISQAEVLVGSGSGFSRWGSFFGSVPRVMFPGQGLGSFGNSGLDEVETDVDEGLPAAFISLVQRRVAQHT